MDIDSLINERVKLQNSIKRECSLIMSMSKIKDTLTVPQYLKKKMGDTPTIVWDYWIGDSKDGNECTKYACRYGVGDVWFYFVFGRDKYKSTGEALVGENYLFRALVAHNDKKNEWYAKEFSPDELDAVKDAVYTDDDDAVNSLELIKDVKERNPLNYA